MIDKNNTYQRCICNWCVNKDNCDKDRYITTNIMGRVSIRCANYQYDKPKE